jgi:hypothetical protein
MTVHVLRLPTPSKECAEEFGRDLWFRRIDPSDPEACEVELLDLYPHRRREVLANKDGAMDFAAQLYLNTVGAAVTEEAI